MHPASHHAPTPGGLRSRVSIWAAVAALLLLPFTSVLVVPAGPGTAPNEVVVQSGDTLGGIAQRLGTTSKVLMDLNGITDPRGLRVGQKLKVPATFAVHKVVAGETLGVIAARHRIKLDALAAYNGITKPEMIRIGQELKIPLNPAAAPPGPTLAPGVLAELGKIRINRRKWTYIVIHHSASPKGSVAGIDRYHRVERRMENGLAYHFLIGNGRDMKDGEIGIGDRWRRQIQGGHLASSALNEKSIGICLVGDFDKTLPTPAQLKSLEALVKFLLRNTDVDGTGVRTHTQINPRPTACPGKNFPTRKMREWF